MTDHFFLDDQYRILTGDEAREAVKRINDAQYLSDGKGVVRVPKERWRVAQDFERRYWMETSRDAKDDRNDDHFENFDGFRALRGRVFEQAIELGCGPFTNLRLIAPICRVSRCTLLDPLIETYKAHPNRTYDDVYLTTDTNALNRFLAKDRPRRALRRVLRKVWPNSLRVRTPIERLLACPIEEMPLDRKYDLIVIINVIEHCYDIDRVFANIRRIANDDAILVFADRYYDHETVASWVTGKRYDAGHPLLVDRHVIDDFLHTTCDVLYENVRHHEWVVKGFDFSHDAVYFVGRVRSLARAERD